VEKLLCRFVQLAFGSQESRRSEVESGALGRRYLVVDGMADEWMDEADDLPGPKHVSGSGGVGYRSGLVQL
jgi:hypothetical protein